MIHNVKVINYLGEELVSELRYPERSGFLIFNMTGIGPEKAEIRTTDIVTADGGIYNSSRLPPRNIVMSVRFFAWEGKTVEDIRQESYKYFPIKKPLTLFIETDNRIGEITGYVESNEPVIFSRETHTQISILCPFPYFYDGSSTGDKITVFGGVEPRFEFPFSNNSLTEPLLIMGDIKIYAEGIVYYDGDAEVGMTIWIDALGPAKHITLNKLETRERMVIDTDRIFKMTGQGITTSDRIIINTVKGKKSIFLLRAGVYTNILNALDRRADWFQLSKGDNSFAFEAQEGIENLTFTISNRTLFEGV